MALPLLKTKTYVPPLRPNLIPRPHLMRRLDQGLRAGCRLALVSAPAGYGKTTLLSEWVRNSRRRIGWVSLDESDNDPARFWAHLTAALQARQPEPAEALPPGLEPHHLPPLEAFLIDLVNDVAAGAPQAVVLDDYHVIRARPIHDSLAFLLDHLPPRVQLIIAGRADPPLPLARLRARGELLELRAADLAFSRQEAHALLNRTMGLDLPGEDVAAVAARTEGWATGLQLVALSAQGSHDRHRLIAGLTGGHRYIVDYLLEEVLSRQPEAVQSFLLETSILDQLTAGLCSAVTGRADAQATLERLEAGNLFIVPLDDERIWYRYHQLFSGALRARLAATSPGRLLALHRRASAWYENEGLVLEAFNHALAAQDTGRAARLADSHCRHLSARGELATILDWAGALPAEEVRSHPALLVSQGWALYLTGRLQATRAHLDGAEEALQRELSPSLPEGRREQVEAALAELALLRLFLARYGEGPERAIELAREALSRVPEQQRGIRGQVHLSLGLALMECGSMLEAIDALGEAARLCGAQGISAAGATATYFLSNLYLLLGQLGRAARICRQALEAARPSGEDSPRPIPALGLIHLGLAQALYERNALEDAEQHVQEAIALGRPAGYQEILVRGYRLLAQVRQARGQAQEAQEAMGRAERVAAGVDGVHCPPAVAAARARLALVQGDLETAERWRRDAPLAAPRLPVGLRDFLSTTLARLLLAQGRARPRGPYLSEAAALLEGLLEEARAGGRVRIVMQVLLLQALVLRAQGRRAGALAALEEALALAGPEGYVRIFVQEGEPVRGMLRQLAARGASSAFVDQLLAALGSGRPRATGSGGRRIAAGARAEPSGLLEPLTRRESDVLRLIVAGLSTRRIAEELYLSTNTVKTHTRSIYGKLGVHSRAQAIRCATELGLL